MRALVTGGTGLIGAHIVRALVNAGHDVRALARRTGRRDLLNDLPVTWITADLLGAERALDAACVDCDVVFHTAAHFAYRGIPPAELHDTAVNGTKAVLQACERTSVPRVVVTSSSVVLGYSIDGTELDEGAPLTSGDREPSYVQAKLAQHQLARKLARELQLDVRFACPTMTIGPTQSRLGPSNGLIVAYLADPLGCTFRGGCNIVSARDVAAGHLLIAEHGVAGDSYLLGSQNVTWRDIHTMIADLAGVAPPRTELNHVLAFLVATGEEIRATVGGREPLSTREQAAMIGRYYWYSHAKAASLGYAPAPARIALIETLSWLAASPHVTREVRSRMRLSDDLYGHRSAATRQPH